MPLYLDYPFFPVPILSWKSFCLLLNFLISLHFPPPILVCVPSAVSAIEPSFSTCPSSFTTGAYLLFDNVAQCSTFHKFDASFAWTSSLSFDRIFEDLDRGVVKTSMKTRRHQHLCIVIHTSVNPHGSAHATNKTIALWSNVRPRVSRFPATPDISWNSDAPPYS